MDQMSNGSATKPTRDLATPSQLSNEADSAWEGSDNQDFRNNSTQLFRHNSDLEPDFPPKPVSFSCTKGPNLNFHGKLNLNLIYDVMHQSGFCHS